MRIPVVIFFVGVIMLIGGIVLAIAIPTTVTWKPKSEVLASDKPLTISAGWISKKDDILSETIMAPNILWGDYDYELSFGTFIIGEVKDIVLVGNATETEGYKFNFYIFDNVNYDLWKEGRFYNAYFEAKDVAHVQYQFPLTKEQATSSFYFVAESPLLLDRVVTVYATINWVEKASIYDRSEYFMSWEILTVEEAKDFMLKGSATELAGKKFNFYIFDTTNYFNWIGDKSYTSYYEVKNVTTTSFSLPLTKDEATSIFYFAAENPLLDTNETVNLSATIEWNEKATIAATVGGIVLGGIIAFLGFIVIIIAGVAALVFKPKAPAPTPPTPPT